MKTSEEVKPSKKKEAGKGDSPRNIFSDAFRKNFDKIKWNDKTKRNY